MFLCDDCTSYRGMTKSHGRCEGCGREASCSNAPRDAYCPKPAAVTPPEPEAPQLPTADNPAVKRTWAEFRESGMLWWANRAMHVFGWAIVVVEDDATGEVIGVEPRRTLWRGFPEDREAIGFRRVTAWMRANAEELLREVDVE